VERTHCATHRFARSIVHTPNGQIGQLARSLAPQKAVKGPKGCVLGQLPPNRPTEVKAAISLGRKIKIVTRNSAQKIANGQNGLLTIRARKLVVEVCRAVREIRRSWRKTLAKIVRDPCIMIRTAARRLVQYIVLGPNGLIGIRARKRVAVVHRDDSGTIQL